MADTTTPFGNKADDESPFVESEPPDDYPSHPADDSYWQEMQRAEIGEEMRQLWGDGPSGRMLRGAELKRWEQLEEQLSKLDEAA